MAETPDNIVNVIAEHAADALLLRLEWMTFVPATVLVLGVGAEVLTQLMKARFPVCVVLTAADTLPSSGVDLIVSNLELSWQADIPSVINAWQTFLRPEGLLMVSAFGPDTLKEWPDQQACVAQRIDMHEIGDALVMTGLADPVMEVEHYSISYSDAAKMMYELVQGQLLLQDTEMPNQINGKWHLTCEVVYGHAWKAAEEKQTTRNGETRVSLNMLRRQLAK